MAKNLTDDSTGKGKYAESKERYKVVLTVFIIGVCIGVIIAERMYVSRPQAASGTNNRSLISNNQPSNIQAATSTKPRSDLEAYLLKIAPDREVLAAVSNKNVMYEGMLATFTTGIKTANIPNHVILALDQETKDWCDDHGVNSFLFNIKIHKVQAGTGDNHAVSAMKFGILQQFMEIDFNVLLTDIDVCILQNPFKFLYRDSDVEGMTDGFDERTAYGSIEGFDDPSMGWGRYAQYYRHFNLNSGLFYVRANNRTLELMKRLDDRLSHQQYWDQTAYNEEMFFLSHGNYKSPQVTVRVMDIYQFMNSKVMFKDVRNRNPADRPPKPVMVHINYHPDKHERMKAVFKFYNEGDDSALKRFPGGSEPGTR